MLDVAHVERAVAQQLGGIGVTVIDPAALMLRWFRMVVRMQCLHVVVTPMLAAYQPRLPTRRPRRLANAAASAGDEDDALVDGGGHAPSVPRRA